jgi:pimeloyl-ACP methyl ester carboxylesterase
MTPKFARTARGNIEYRLEGNGPVVMVLNGGHCSRETRLSHERLAVHGFCVLTPSRSGYDGTRSDVGRSAQEAADALAALRLAPRAIIRSLMNELTTLDVEEVMGRLSPTDLTFIDRMIAASRSGTGFLNDLQHRVSDLHNLRVPVLAMYSPHDKAVPPRNARRLAEEVPRCDLFEVTSDSHLIWIGPRADQVWQRRLAFLGG